MAALGKASDDVKKKIKRETYAAVNQRYPEGNILLDSGTLIISSEK